MGWFRTICVRFILIPIIALYFVGCGKDEKTPPQPNVVATYDNAEITVEDLEDYIEQRTKGLKAFVGGKLVPLRDQIGKDAEVYRGIIQDIVLDEMVKRKIKEKQLDNRGNIRHALQHLEEEFTLNQLHQEMHEKDKIPVGEVEIQNYYDANRDRYGERTLYEVRDEIKNILASQKEDEYVVDYIAELKDTATITKNYEILRVPEPTDDEVREYYEKNRENYQEDEKWILEQIEIADSDGKAKEKAQKAWVKLGSGEAFEVVAEGLGEGGTFTTVDYVVGTRGETFDKAVTSLSPGEFSRPIQEGSKYFIVRLKETSPARPIPFEEVKEVVRRFLMDEREQKLYDDNKSKTLFTLHGRRFTFGDFYQEYKELPLIEQEKYRSYEERVKLVDRMIERLLLLEDSYDRMLNTEKSEEIEHLREDMLKQEWHREEVHQKLEVTDDEVKQFYEENKERFQTPPRMKISVIVVRQGQNEEENKRAEEKIQEAYKKLKPGMFKKGLPFEEVAKQYSEDSRTAQNGGELDHWILGETGDPLFETMNHAFHEKFMHLKEGEITEPFLLGRDYLIVKVREKEGPQQRDFEEVKEHLREDLELKKHDELTAKMYDEMLNQANLVIYDQVLESFVSQQEEADSSQSSSLEEDKDTSTQ